jgi:hypothetical protein
MQGFVALLALERLINAELVGFLFDYIAGQVNDVIKVASQVEVQDKHSNQYTHYLLNRSRAVCQKHYTAYNGQGNAQEFHFCVHLCV